MNRHLMIDLETLGTKENAVILSLGAVLFTREGLIEERLWVFDLREQENCRRIQADTLFFWLKQSPEARKVFELCEGRGESVRKIASEFCELAQKGGSNLRVWSNGAAFDVPILEHLLGQVKMPIPWKFWNVRCYRTLKAMFGIEKGVTRTGTLHSALDDSRFQAICIMNTLKNKPEVDQ